MPIQFPCPSCHKQLKISNPAMAGKKIKCPKCGAVITAPAAEDDVPSAPMEAVKPPRIPPPLPEADEELEAAPPRMPPPRSAAREELEEDEPEERLPARRRPMPAPAADRPG